jgi:hypothetical protein
MPDLWKALGDVYGDADPDGPPVKAEPPAVQRSAPLLDDDLAAALSAALVNAPTASVAPSPAAAPAPPPAPIPAPVAVPLAVAVPVEPEAEPAAQKVASWLVEIEQRQHAREQGPDLEAALPAGPTWTRVDDDILPKSKAGRRGRR